MTRIVKDVVIIGAGAAGLMCAIEAGGRGRSVVVLDHAGRIGNKIRVSGGGHCNFTNTNAGFEHYLSNNPHFCRSALARFTPRDFMALVTAHGIRHFEKKLGQMFCLGSAGQIVEMLIALCRKARAELVPGCQGIRVSRNRSFIVETAGMAYEAESLVIATGGLSMRNLGATGFGYDIARQFKLRVTPLRPALTPFRFRKEDIARYGSLSGVSFDAIVHCGGKNFHESVLFTHRGLSGPAMLQVSSYWKEGDSLRVDLLPGIDFPGILQEKSRGKIHLATLLSRFLPKRFALKWCDLFMPSRPLCQFSQKELAQINVGLHEWIILPAGLEGFEVAEVTMGGVDTNELSSKTLEARSVPGLYFIGEVLDVTGQLGGFNLQWAWSSGFTAGQYA
ncbi:MAG: NAD(P)/FAD-dependent oxidoreductase [Syntrophobacteraceae bacterium]